MDKFELFKIFLKQYISYCIKNNLHINFKDKNIPLHLFFFYCSTNEKHLIIVDNFHVQPYGIFDIDIKTFFQNFEYNQQNLNVINKNIKEIDIFLKKYPKLLTKNSEELLDVIHKWTCYIDHIHAKQHHTSCKIDSKKILLEEKKIYN